MVRMTVVPDRGQSRGCQALNDESEGWTMETPQRTIRVLRPDERWMTAPRREVAERAGASIRQDSVIQAAWRRFQPLRRSLPRGRPRASYSATGP